MFHRVTWGDLMLIASESIPCFTKPHIQWWARKGKEKVKFQDRLGRKMKWLQNIFIDGATSPYFAASVEVRDRVRDVLLAKFFTIQI